MKDIPNKFIDSEILYKHRFGYILWAINIIQNGKLAL